MLKFEFQILSCVMEYYSTYLLQLGRVKVILNSWAMQKEAMSWIWPTRWANTYSTLSGPLWSPLRYICP